MEDVVKIEDTPSTSVLPSEILSKIFTFLSLTDRRAIRLTCRAWYDCCACVNITKHEEFVFRADPSVERIAEVILRSNHSLLNLEFQCLPVGMLPASVWKVCGLRIRELEFYMCQWDNETISNIIFHCENLTSLVINENENVHPYAVVDAVDAVEPIRIAYSLRLLNDFIGKGIRRPKLHTLSIFIKYDEHETVLRKIFLLHPCIKHFTFRLISDDRSKFLDPFAMRLDKCLNPDTQLESLQSVILTPDGRMGTLVDQTERGLKLKRLVTWLMNDEMGPNLEQKIFNFFRSQTNLVVIILTTKIASESFFYNILEHCPKLQVLCLYTEWCMDLKPSEVSRFIASISKLTFLALGFKVYDNGQVPSFDDLLHNTVQLNLTSLEWTRHYSVGDSDFCAAFFQRCSSLTYLRLTYCCDTTLQIIFKHLLQLQTLILDGREVCTDFGLFGITDDGNEDGYSIKRLQQLKHLQLFDATVRLTERTALEFQLPCLEVLSVDPRWCHELSEAALNHLVSHFPKLRLLAINSYLEVNYLEDTIRLCRKLNNLQRLILHGYIIYDTMEEEMKSIFDACPSLRYISDDWSNTFTRDPFTGEILFKGYLKFS